jgi:hypothetical protein
MRRATKADAAIAGKSQRILAFDLIRGIFLLVIMVDHIELYPNGLDLFTGKGRLWVSAAEGFFFMSGLLIGMVYKRRLYLGMKFIFKRMWLRAAELYVVGVGLTFVFLAWAIYSNHPNVKDALVLPFDWPHYAKEALLMRFTYGWSDFLVRFSILMFFAPFVFYLVAKRKWWIAVVGIFGIWAFRGQSFTLAWQLIFNAGIIIGFYWQDLESRFRKLTSRQRTVIKRSFVAAFGLTFIASYACVFVLSLLNYLWGLGHLPQWLQHATWTWNRLNYDVWVYADKWTMAPLRIVLFCLWFPALYWIVHKYENQINNFTKGILELLGRNSLFVYTVHAFIVFAFKLYLIPIRTNFLQNFLITSAGLALLVIITKYYKKIQPSLSIVNLRSTVDSKA